MASDLGQDILQIYSAERHAYAQGTLGSILLNQEQGGALCKRIDEVIREKEASYTHSIEAWKYLSGLFTEEGPSYAFQALIVEQERRRDLQDLNGFREAVHKTYLGGQRND